MASILTAFPIVVSDNKGGGWEGVCSNDSADPDGLTVYGLQQTDDGDWAMWPAVKKLVIAAGNITAALVADTAIYNSAMAYHKAKYWDKLNLDYVDSQPIANELYSAGLNIGLGTAAKFLQQLLNVFSGGAYADLPVTGYIGSLTLAALNQNTNQHYILQGLGYLQGAYYVNAGLANKALRVFERGWFNRDAAFTNK